MPSATKKRPAKTNKKATGKTAGSRKKKAADNEVKPSQQAAAIIIMALAVLIAVLVFYPGVHVWRMMHEFVLGLFGVGSVLCPLFLVYIAWLAAFGGRKISIPLRLLESLMFMVLICSAVQIYTYGGAAGLRDLYDGGRHLYTGGVIGAPGALLFRMFGRVGAGIIDILLLIVIFLLITGITLVQIYERVSTAAKYRPKRDKAKELLSETKGFAAAGQKVRYNIDVDLGPVGEKKAEKTPPVKQKKPSPALDELVGKIANLKEETVAVKAPSAAKTEIEPLRVDEGEQVRLYNYPPITLLDPPEAVSNADVADELKANAGRLVDTLRSFGVETRITDISRGPTVTRYELQPSAGVKISRITSLADDIALNLASAGVRIEAPIPNKAAVGIEVPNRKISVVHIREIVDSPEFRDATSKLTVSIGRDIAGKVAVADIFKMPHMLIAGSTGSGKSVCINSIIISLLYKAAPDEVKLLMIDPKIVELSVYNGIPHLLVPVVTDPRRAAGALNWAVSEMQTRYKHFADTGMRDIRGYNSLAKRRDDLEPMPQIVIIIDELADLIMEAPGEVEEAICRLAQKARAAGMHLVIATQRPSVDVITGLIKANIPSRIAFAVSSQVDSRVILDSVGADRLLGRGDMLFWPQGAPKPTRLQCCYVSDEEVQNVIDFIKRDAEATYDEDVISEIDRQSTAEKKSGGSSSGEDSDPMLPNAIECVIDAGVASTSLLQRRLKLGYARAARIIDEMEARGFVGPLDGSKPREVLISRQQYLEMSTSRD